MVTPATTRALVVFAPRECSRARLLEVLDLTSGRMREFTGARDTGRLVP